MLQRRRLLHSLACLASVQLSLAQPSPSELAPLCAALSTGPYDASFELERRVPLMTDDSTRAPLVDLQVFAPPVVPKSGSKCTVTLLKHGFGDGSYGTPTVVPYAPPTAKACGPVGKWAAISLNLTVYS
jgi:hypothetical protein